MDPLSIASVIHRLKDFKGHKIKSIIPHTKLSFSMEFKNDFLTVDLTPGKNMIFLSEDKIDSPKNDTSFHHFLKKTIQRSRFEGACLLRDDRIIKLEFFTEKYGVKHVFYMIIELMGKHSNIFILDDEEAIISSLKMINAQVREMELQEKYKPINNRKCLGEFSVEKISQFLKMPLKERKSRILEEFNGLHPSLINELFQSSSSPESIHEIISQIENYLNDKENDLKIFFRIIDNRKINSFTGELSDSENEFHDVNDAYLKLIRFWSLKDHKIRETSVYLRVRKKLKTQLEQCMKGLKKSEKYENYRIKGDLFFAKFSEIEEINSELAEVNDFTGEKVEFSLDPRFDLKKNGKLLYKKYKKFKGTYKKTEKRIEDINNKLEKLEEEFASVEEFGSITDIFKKKGKISKNKKKSKKIKKNDNSKFYREELTEDGHKLFIGKSSRGNDYVISHLARAWDLWFHAKDLRGSHVVLRIEKNEEPDDETIAEAARMAAFYSKGRTDTKIFVSMCRRSDIKKVKGTPGLVTIKKEEILLVEYTDEMS